MSKLKGVAIAVAVCLAIAIGPGAEGSRQACREAAAEGGQSFLIRPICSAVGAGEGAQLAGGR